MLSATLRAGRSEYSIGGKVRALRLEKTMGLVELWQHTRLSRALLSKSRTTTWRRSRTHCLQSRR